MMTPARHFALQKLELGGHDFDLRALLMALRSLGYEKGQVRYEAHPTNSPQPRIIHAVRFEGDEQQVARVILNLGLLSGKSPLPHYFRRLLDDSHYGSLLRKLLETLDHMLLEERVHSHYPEEYFGDWRRAQHSLLRTVRLDCPATLQWLFESTFFEFDVRVRHTPLDRAIPAPEALLGEAMLGKSALGGHSRVPTPGFSVTLRARDPESDDGQSFYDVVMERLHARVFPALRSDAVSLRVTLIILGRQNLASTDGKSQAGFSHFSPGPEDEPLHSAEMLVFQGEIPAAS